MSPIFLTLAQVLEIHQDQIARYGGEPGTRDVNLLRSALGMPYASFGGEYLLGDLFEMAAAYLFHITQNHPFVDGNERTGAMAAYVFLILNGYEWDVVPDTMVEAVMAVARGECTRPELATMLRGSCRPL